MTKETKNTGEHEKLQMREKRKDMTDERKEWPGWDLGLFHLQLLGVLIKYWEDKIINIKTPN